MGIFANTDVYVLNQCRFYCDKNENMMIGLCLTKLTEQLNHCSPFKRYCHKCVANAQGSLLDLLHLGGHNVCSP